MRTIELVGPKGYIHGWIFVGAPGVGARVSHPSLGAGTVTSHAGGTATVRFDKGGVSKSFEARTGKAGAAAKLAPRSSGMRHTISDEQYAAGQAGGRGQAHQMALARSQQVHLRESTGLTIPARGDMRAGTADAEYAQAGEHLLNGRYSDANAAMDRAVAKGTGTAATRLGKFRDQVRSATVNPKTDTLPPLSPLGKNDDGSLNVIDHQGNTYSVKMAGGNVTVKGTGGTNTAAAGDSPTDTARRLAGQLTARDQRRTQAAKADLGTSAGRAQVAKIQRASERASAGPSKAEMARNAAIMRGSTSAAPEGDHAGVHYRATTSSGLPSYELTYKGTTGQTLARGRSPQEAATEFKAGQDKAAATGIRTDAERARAQDQIGKQDIARTRALAAEPLGLGEVVAAYQAAHGGKNPPKSALIRWARSGVPASTRSAAWYKAAAGAKTGKSLARPRGRAIQLAGGRVKTPGPQRAAGRRKLAAAKQALPGGSFPVPNVAYLKKAIRSVGRAPASKRPALAALIRKRAAELKATNASGVKGTWAFQGSRTGGRVLELVGPKGYTHNWEFHGTKAQLVQHMTEHHSGVPAGGRRVGPKSPSIAQLQANHAEQHRVRSDLDHTHSGDDAPEDKANKMSANAFRRTDGTQDALQGHRDAAKAHRAAAQLSSSPATSNYHTKMASLHSRVASGRKTSNRAQDQAFGLGLANSTHGKVVDLAMATMTASKMPVVRGAADVQLSRSGPGKITVMHKSTGFKIGTLAQAGNGWQGVHASGAKTPASGTMGGAVAGLVAAHNQLARGKKLPPAQQDGTATYAHPAGDGINLAGAMPRSTPASSASDGPRVTTVGGSGSGPAGLTGEAAVVYAKLIKKGLKPGQAAALAKRAAAMHAKAAGPKASAA